MDTDYILKRLNEVGVSSNCQKCGGEKSLDVSPLLTLQGEGPNLDKAIKGYGLTCLNCGHMDFFSSNILK